MGKPDFKILLHGQNFRATPGRVALLETLWAAQLPLSVAAIAQILEKIDEATLYRALEALANAGLLRRIDLNHGHAHYEFEREHHHHLVCTNCGFIEDVEDCSIERAQKHMIDKSKKFVSIYSHNLEFFGQCKSCLNV
jgi:Fur family transcriptional regulator, ferric uptake regulator